MVSRTLVPLLLLCVLAQCFAKDYQMTEEEEYRQTVLSLGLSTLCTAGIVFSVLFFTTLYFKRKMLGF